MEAFGFIIALLLIGLLLQRVGAPEDFAKSLNFFIIYVSLPATVLLQVPKISLDYSAIGLIAVPWLLVPLSVGMVLWITRNASEDVRAALLLVVPLGNTSFLGIPMIHALLGESAIPYVLIYDQFGTFLILSLYGAAIVSRYESGTIRKRLILKKMLLFPPFGFLIAALIFGEVPLSFKPYVEQLSSTLVPLALISVGYSLRLGGEVDKMLFTKALGIKLLVMPMAAWGILVCSGASATAVQTGVLESGMPSMITAGALAIAAGFAPALSAAMVGYGLLISLVTLPLLAALMKYWM